MINFGVGKIIAVPTNQYDGSPIVIPTPVILGTIQEISIEATVETKMLYGSRRYPIAVGQGKSKTEVKAKYAELDGNILGGLFFGKTPSTGIRAAVFDHSATIPSASPYEVTVSPPNSGTFIADFGVLNALTGEQFVRVASAPAAGQYTVNTSTGRYTFASADAGKAIRISYEYSAPSGGRYWTITNDLMGYSPSFTLFLQNSFSGRTMVCKLNRASSGKLSLPLKSDDFAIYDFEAEAYADANGELGYICMF